MIPYINQEYYFHLLEDELNLKFQKIILAGNILR